MSETAEVLPFSDAEEQHFWETIQNPYGYAVDRTYVHRLFATLRRDRAKADTAIARAQKAEAEYACLREWHGFYKERAVNDQHQADRIEAQLKAEVAQLKTALMEERHRSESFKRTCEKQEETSAIHYRLIQAKEAEVERLRGALEFYARHHHALCSTAPNYAREALSDLPTDQAGIR